MKTAERAVDDGPLIHAVSDAVLSAVYLTRDGDDGAKLWLDEAGCRRIIAAYENAKRDH